MNVPQGEIELRVGTIDATAVRAGHAEVIQSVPEHLQIVILAPYSIGPGHRLRN